jgi:hypothetical protein
MEGFFHSIIGGTFLLAREAPPRLTTHTIIKIFRKGSEAMRRYQWIRWRKLLLWLFAIVISGSLLWAGGPTYWAIAWTVVSLLFQLLFAIVIANEAQVPFAYASAPSFQNMFFGVGNLKVMGLYRKARKRANEYGACIIFIDEIDAIGMSRQSGGGGGGFLGMGGAGLLNELLLQMDPPNIDNTRIAKLLRSLGLRRKKAERTAASWPF